MKHAVKMTLRSKRYGDASLPNECLIIVAKSEKCYTARDDDETVMIQDDDDIGSIEDNARYEHHVRNQIAVFDEARDFGQGENNKDDSSNCFWCLFVIGFALMVILIAILFIILATKVAR